MEVIVGGQSYRIGKLDAREQMHVYRRLAPILTGIGGGPALAAFNAMPRGADGGIDLENADVLAGLLAPAIDAISIMPDHEVDYVLDKCLAKVERAVDGDRAWAPVFSRGAMMYADIGLPEMLELAGRVIMGQPGDGGILDFLAKAGRRASADPLPAAPS